MATQISMQASFPTFVRTQSLLLEEMWKINTAKMTATSTLLSGSSSHASGATFSSSSSNRNDRRCNKNRGCGGAATTSMPTPKLLVALPLVPILGSTSILGLPKWFHYLARQVSGVACLAKASSALVLCRPCHRRTTPPSRLSMGRNNGWHRCPPLRPTPLHQRGINLVSSPP